MKRLDADIGSVWWQYQWCSGLMLVVLAAISVVCSANAVGRLAVHRQCFADAVGIGGDISSVLIHFPYLYQTTESR